jgi:hypothetical protein
MGYIRVGPTQLGRLTQAGGPNRKTGEGTPWRSWRSGVAAAGKSGDRRPGEVGQRVGEDHGEAAHQFWGSERGEAYRNGSSTAVRVGRRGLASEGPKERRREAFEGGAVRRRSARRRGGWVGGRPELAGDGETLTAEGAGGVGSLRRRSSRRRCKLEDGHAQGRRRRTRSAASGSSQRRSSTALGSTARGKPEPGAGRDGENIFAWRVTPAEDKGQVGGMGDTWRLSADRNSTRGRNALGRCRGVAPCRALVRAR